METFKRSPKYVQTPKEYRSKKVIIRCNILRQFKYLITNAALQAFFIITIIVF